MASFARFIVIVSCPFVWQTTTFAADKIDDIQIQGANKHSSDAYLSDISVEMLQKITASIKEVSDLQALARTNKNTMAKIQSIIAKKIINVSNFTFNKVSIKAKFRHELAQVQKLKISTSYPAGYAEEADHDWVQALPPSVTELWLEVHLPATTQTNQAFRVLLRDLSTMPKLQALHLTISADHKNINININILNELKQIAGLLESLNLNHHLSEQGAEVLGLHYRHFNKIKHLKLSMLNCGIYKAPWTFKSIKQLTHLETLGLKLYISPSYASYNQEEFTHTVRILGEIFQNLPQLTSLHLKSTSFDLKHFAMLAPEIQKCAQLKDLALELGFYSEDFRLNPIEATEAGKIIAESLETLDQLEKLSLLWTINDESHARRRSKAEEVTSEALIKLFEKATKLTSLDLLGSAFYGQNLKDLAPSLSQLKQLRRLSLLLGENFGPEESIIVASILSALTQLTTFEFPSFDEEGQNVLRPEEMKELAPSLAKLIHLKSFHLGYYKLESESAEILGSFLTKLTKLEYLGLPGCHLGHGEFKALAPGLRYLTQLKTLDLSNNYIGPEGAKALAKTLYELNKLRSVNLCENRIGFEGAKVLIPIFKKCHSYGNMHTFPFLHNNCSDENLTAIHENLSAIRISLELDHKPRSWSSKEDHDNLTPILENLAGISNTLNKYMPLSL